MDDTINASANVDATATASALAQEYAADIVERLNAEPLERASAVTSPLSKGSVQYTGHSLVSVARSACDE